MSNIAKEVAKRRTFAIISHPDAGKTTLTEKLLLFAGAIQIAGSVKSRKSDRHASSDWMDIEKQRGISVASSVMQMEYRDCVINLLDTPGHQDFSEDTYRVLTAVDAALMVIDAANGVEPQTIRLLQVCRARNTPIITFINKLDREVQEPLDLLSEIEDHLGMDAIPFSWPVGMARRFGGVFNIPKDQMHVFDSKAKDHRAENEELIPGLHNPETEARFGAEFAFVFPNTTKENSYIVIERLRLAVQNHPIQINESTQITVTFSAGIAQLEHNESLVDLLQLADKMLYKSKKLGRNQVTLSLNE